jgi:hypothetical protein
MDALVATNIINSGVAIGTLILAIVAIVAIVQNRSQARDDWLHTQQLATEERKHQIRPIMAPEKEIFNSSMMEIDPNTSKKVEKQLYTSEQRIDWSWPYPIRIDLQNMGNGPALNLHGILYGNEDTNQSQFVSWDNIPVEARSPITVELKHRSDPSLIHGNMVNDKHVLYDKSLDSPTNPWSSRIARLTLTYHDLFGTKYVSIFHYTIEHRWIHVVTEEITGNPARDLKELNDQKKQQASKFSAPPPITSQGN